MENKLENSSTQTFIVQNAVIVRFDNAVEECREYLAQFSKPSAGEQEKYGFYDDLKRGGTLLGKIADVENYYQELSQDDQTRYKERRANTLNDVARLALRYFDEDVEKVREVTRDPALHNNRCENLKNLLELLKRCGSIEAHDNKEQSLYVNHAVYEANRIYWEFRDKYKQLSEIPKEKYNTFKSEFKKSEQTFLQWIDQYANEKTHITEGSLKADQVLSVDGGTPESWYEKLKNRFNQIERELSEMATLAATGRFQELREQFIQIKEDPDNKDKIVEYYVNSKYKTGANGEREFDLTYGSMHVDEAIKILDKRFYYYSSFQYEKYANNIINDIPSEDPVVIERLLVEEKDERGILPLDQVEESYQNTYQKSIDLLNDHKRVKRMVLNEMELVHDYFEDAEKISQIDEKIILRPGELSQKGIAGKAPYLKDKWNKQKADLVQKKLDDLNAEITQVKAVFKANPQRASSDSSRLIAHLAPWKQDNNFKEYFYKAAELKRKIDSIIKEINALEGIESFDDMKKKIYEIELEIHSGEKLDIPVRLEVSKTRAEAAADATGTLDKLENKWEKYSDAITSNEKFLQLKTSQIREDISSLAGLKDYFEKGSENAFVEARVRFENLQKNFTSLSLAIAVRDALNPEIILDYQEIEHKLTLLSTTTNVQQFKMVVDRLNSLFTQKKQDDDKIGQIYTKVLDELKNKNLEYSKLVKNLKEIQINKKVQSSYQKRLYTLEAEYQNRLMQAFESIVSEFEEKVLEFDQDMENKAITTKQLNSVATDLNRFKEVELGSNAKGILRKGRIARSKCLALMQESGNEWQNAALSWKAADNHARYLVCQKINLLHQMLEGIKATDLDVNLPQLEWDNDVFLVKVYWDWKKIYEEHATPKKIREGVEPDFTPIYNSLSRITRNSVDSEDSESIATEVVGIWTEKDYSKRFRAYSKFQEKFSNFTGFVNRKQKLIGKLYESSKKFTPTAAITNLYALTKIDVDFENIEDKKEFDRLWQGFMDSSRANEFAKLSVTDDPLSEIKMWILGKQRNPVAIRGYLAQYQVFLGGEVSRWFDPGVYPGTVGGERDIIGAHVEGAREVQQNLVILENFLHQLEADGILSATGFVNSIGDLKGQYNVDVLVVDLSNLQTLIEDTRNNLSAEYQTILDYDDNQHIKVMLAPWDNSNLRVRFTNHPAVQQLNRQIENFKKFASELKNLSKCFASVIELDAKYGKYFPPDVSDLCIQKYQEFKNHPTTGGSQSWFAWGLYLIREFEQKDPTLKSDWKNCLKLREVDGRKLDFDDSCDRLRNGEDQRSELEKIRTYCFRQEISPHFDFAGYKSNGVFKEGLIDYLGYLSGQDHFSVEDKSSDLLEEENTRLLFENTNRILEKIKSMYCDKDEIRHEDINDGLIKFNSYDGDSFIGNLNKRLSSTAFIRKEGFHALSRWNAEIVGEIEQQVYELEEFIDSEISGFNQFSRDYEKFMKLRAAFLEAERDYSELFFAGFLAKMLKKAKLRKTESMWREVGENLSKFAPYCDDAVRFNEYKGEL